MDSLIWGILLARKAYPAIMIVQADKSE